MKKLGLLEVLEGIEDSRRERSVWYPLHEVLFIFIAAVICGATSYVKVEMFGKSKEKWLKKYIQLENGVPDACTFRNVVKSIDTQQLHTVFIYPQAVGTAGIKRLHRDNRCNGNAERDCSGHHE